MLDVQMSDPDLTPKVSTPQLYGYIDAAERSLFRIRCAQSYSPGDTETIQETLELFRRLLDQIHATPAMLAVHPVTP
jgi:hypothetical protein